MSYKLQFLIPQYKETDEIVKPLLDSIALQQSVNFNQVSMIICNDGSDVHLSEDLLRSYPFKIEYYVEPHRGVSATRNFCLDRATADYIMFCDADDMFCHMLGVYQILQEIEHGFDSMVSLFIEELKNPETGEIFYENREMDGIFVHGKVFRRQYLIEQNIRFDERLNVCCEDSYFVSLCVSATKNTVYCPVPFYMWKYREGSVSHRDPKYELKAYKYIIQSNAYLIEDLLKRGIVDKACIYSAALVINVFSAIHDQNLFGVEEQNCKRDTERLMNKWCKNYRCLYEKAPYKEKCGILDFVYDDFDPEDTQDALNAVDRWLDQITES